MKIFIKVKTSAKNNKIEKVDDNNFIISTTQSPEKGKANKAIIKILANQFSVSQANIEIISGLSSRHKIIEINN